VGGINPVHMGVVIAAPPPGTARTTSVSRDFLPEQSAGPEGCPRPKTPASRLQVKGADVLRYANLRLEEKAKSATINRELAALRAGA
jgi:hypothetical protein